MKPAARRVSYMSRVASYQVQLKKLNVTLSSRWSLQLISFLLAFLLLTRLESHSAQTNPDTVDSLQNQTPRLIVRVDRREIKNRKIMDTLDISLETFRFPVAGFDLKIACNSPYVSIVGIIPGKVLDSCRWDYFTARRLNTQSKFNYPLTLWKAVGLAQMPTDTSRPICFGLDSAASLVRLIVSNQHVLQMPETTAAIFFFWEQCTDNVISGISGEHLALSSNVADYYPVDLLDSENLFPTHRGAPRQCVSLSALNPPKKCIEFQNGGVSFGYRSNEPSKVIRDDVAPPLDSHLKDSVKHKLP